MNTISMKANRMNAISKRRQCVMLGVVVIAIIATYGIALCIQAVQTSRKSPAALSAQQIAEKSAAMCRMLTDTNSPLQQTVEERYIVRADGTKHKVWAVECGDPQNEHFARTLWDPKTGQLLYAVRLAMRQTSQPSSDLSLAGAADMAWHWMGKLGVAGLAPHWKLTRHPERVRNSWRVVMRSNDTTATVVFDRSTNDLVYVVVKKDEQTLKAS